MHPSLSQSWVLPVSLNISLIPEGNIHVFTISITLQRENPCFPPSLIRASANWPDTQHAHTEASCWSDCKSRYVSSPETLLQLGSEGRGSAVRAAGAGGGRGAASQVRDTSLPIPSAGSPAHFIAVRQQKAEVRHFSLQSLGPVAKPLIFTVEG